MTSLTNTRGSAGASAEAWRRQLRRARPWWRRALDALGWWPDTRTGASQRAGVVGEQRTAALIDPLRRAGWSVRHDLAIPGSRANVDHMLIPPHGQYAIVLDSKLWSAKRGPVTVRNGRLVHGGEDRQRAVETVLWEASKVRAALGVRVVPLVVVHSAPVTPGLAVDGVTVVGADQLLPLLHMHARRSRPNPARVLHIAQAAARALPDYT
jgi:hypothetical protein